MLATILKSLIAVQTSINRIGYKTFSITLINDKEIINALLSKVKRIV